MTSDNRSLRSIVAQLAGLPALTLDGQTITGTELALTVAINPELPYAEAMKTPQLVAELGRMVARALRVREDAELAYRIWRDGLVHKLTNDIAAAKAAGFECAVNPGADAKGNPKEPKTPSASAVEVYLRTLPDYRTYNEAVSAATETWAALHAAFEGAKSRQWAVRMKEESGGNASGPAAEPEVAGPTWDPSQANYGAVRPHVEPVQTLDAVRVPPGAAPLPPGAPPPPLPQPATMGPPPPPPLPYAPPAGSPAAVPPGPPPPPSLVGDNRVPPPGFPPPGETGATAGMEQKRKGKPPPPPLPTTPNS